MKQPIQDQPRKPRLTRFRIALSATVISIVGWSFISTFVAANVAADPKYYWYNNPGGKMWSGSVILWGIALVAAIFALLTDRREIAKGIWLGLGIAAILLIPSLILLVVVL
jgi:hypothetical protein